MNKFVDLFGCIMNSEKLIWIKKTEIRLTVVKDYGNYFISITMISYDNEKW